METHFTEATHTLSDWTSRLDSLAKQREVQIAAHYLTCKPERIISQIKRREKKVVAEYYLAEQATQIIKQSLLENKENDISFPPHPPIEEMFEKLIVKNWGGMVSVFPVFETALQLYNETWVKFNRRRGTPHQEFGALSVVRESNKIFFEVWRGGEQVTCEERTLLQQGIATQSLTLRFLGLDSLKKTWLHNFSFRDNEVFCDFPLFLPENWEKIWQITGSTQFTIFCC